MARKRIVGPWRFGSPVALQGAALASGSFGGDAQIVGKPLAANAQGKATAAPNLTVTPSDASWGTVSNLTFIRGQAQSYDLPTIYGINYNSVLHDVNQTGGSETLNGNDGMSLSADGVLSYNGSGSGTHTISNVQLTIVDTAQADWSIRINAVGVKFAENFSTYNTAADWYNRWHQGQMIPVFTPKNPSMGSTWTNAWEIVTTPGHVLSGKALRAWHGKNNYGAAGTIDNQWACIPFSGNPNNVAAGYMTEFYFQICIWVDSFFNYGWKLGDGSLGGIKTFILDQWDTSATQGEVVITNQYNFGFVTGYHSVGPSFDRTQNTPGYSPNFAWQPAIDNGTPLDATLASYLRRYGPMRYGMYPSDYFNQAATLTSQGVPNSDAATGGVAWNIGGITVVEVYVKLNVAGNSTVKAWAAKYGDPPKKIIDATGVNLGSRVGSLGTGWSGVTLSNLIYTATGAQNPNYPTDAYLDYAEFIISRNPIPFPQQLSVPLPGALLTYSSEFTTTENPLSEGGNWTIPPQPSGIKWTVMRTDGNISGGIAYGSNGALDTFDDSYAKFVGFDFPSATSIEIVAVLYRSPSLAAGSAYPEKELWFCIDDGVNGSDAFLRGYEVMLNPAGTSNMGKWLGGQNMNEIPVFPNTVGVGDVADGAEFKVRITRSGSTNTIEMYFNGVLQYSNTDTTFGGTASYTIGRPGFGAFARPASQGQHSLFGFKSITIRQI